MSKYLHIKKFLCKVFTCWMPYKQRILYREALYWFSFPDYWRFKHANYHIVSLGANCLPRGLTTAAKLKPRRFYGEKTCVFDLYISNLKRNIDLLENNFKDFFSDIDKTNFPHDDELSHDEFIKRYENRIKNFQEVLQSDKMLYFIFSDYRKIPLRKDILRLYAVLERKRSGKPFKLILLTSEYIDNLPNVVQLPEKFTIDDGCWLVHIINEYGDYDNKYTQYCKKMKEKLSSVFVTKN